MVIVMDTQTGLLVEDEFGPFEDEVLGANWMPGVNPAAAPILAQREPARPSRHDDGFDADTFLRNVYLSQE